MLVYPQLGTGALGQFPIRKQRHTRTVTNSTSDGRTIKLADPAGATTEWQLDYADITDSEAGAIETFFAAAEGTLNGFTFLDPAGNLLAWSGQLDDAVWVRGPMLSLAGGEPDPAGGALAWRLTNTGGGPQAIIQTLAAPGDYVYCLSVYARAQANTVVTALLGSVRVAQSVTAGWNRITFTGTGGAGAESVQFGLEIRRERRWMCTDHRRSRRKAHPSIEPARSAASTQTPGCATTSWRSRAPASTGIHAR